MDAPVDLGSEPGRARSRKCAQDGDKLIGCEGMPGDGLTERSMRKVPSDMLALKPYWGKPTVRDFRGGDGNVGIIRSPVRAIVLLDHENRWDMEIKDASVLGHGFAPAGLLPPAGQEPCSRILPLFHP